MSDRNVRYILENSLEKKSEPQKNPFTKNETDKIINDCRVLRSLSNSVANERISNVIGNWEKIFAQNLPNFVFSVTVDNYILDIISRLCALSSVKYIGYVNSPIPGYSRFTVRGEFSSGHDGPNKEAIVDFYKKRKKPAHYIKQSKLSNLKQKTLMIARRFYFEFQYKLGKNDYHTLANYYWGRVNRGVLQGTIGVDVRGKYYIPLQYTPECTVDYWSPVEPNNDYEEFVKSIIVKNRNLKFVVKEHPAYIGNRKKDFIIWLNNQENCEILDSRMDNFDVVSLCEAVCTLTGTVAIETLMLGGNVVILGDIPYYLRNCVCTNNTLGKLYVSDESIRDTIASNLSNSLVRGGVKLSKHIIGWKYDRMLAEYFKGTINYVLKDE